MEWWIYVLVVLAGVIAGFINTLAGSGSLLTLPILIFAGLPANIANGTNRIGILLQSIVAVGGYKQKKAFEWRDGIWLTIPAAIGAFVGAFVAVDVDEQILNKIIGGLLVFMFFLLILNPQKWLKEHSNEYSGKISLLKIIIFLGIGFYGGFIQAGVGFFILAGLVLGSGMDLIRANAVKVLVTLVFTVIALSVFIYNNQVNYLLGIIMGVGNMIGAWLATRFAVQKGAKFVHKILLACVLAFAVKLLFF
ncbi:MAG: sulfite exporter TauE/SafE family protein [Bacteroidales bacterium]|nr:sulfite exporter TauE/SafE family protein [Bacteroidales bacterium]HRX31439.1 sulfite exporter TauE/SafE family protein [Tenuifilaceae bacterium]